MLALTEDSEESCWEKAKQEMFERGGEMYRGKVGV